MVTVKGIKRRALFEKGRRLKWMDQPPHNVNPRDYSDSNFEGRNRTTSNKSDRQFTLGEESSS